jgi:uncharacterized membrane protein YciS (DUF1049 family)
MSATMWGVLLLLLAVILALTAGSYNGQWILALCLVAAGGYVLAKARQP